MAEVLGVDFGGVICDRSVVSDMYPPIPGALDVLNRLRCEKFGGNIHIVSCANVDLRFSIMSWLIDRNFFNLTGISFDQLHFCTQRDEKARICQTLGIGIFVDDRTEVHQSLHDAGIQKLFLFQGREEEIAPRRHVLPHVTQVNSWDEIAQQLLG